MIKIPLLSESLMNESEEYILDDSETSLDLLDWDISSSFFSQKIPKDKMQPGDWIRATNIDFSNGIISRIDGETVYVYPAITYHRKNGVVELKTLKKSQIFGVWRPKKGDVFVKIDNPMFDYDQYTEKIPVENAMVGDLVLYKSKKYKTNSDTGIIKKLTPKKMSLYTTYFGKVMVLDLNRSEYTILDVLRKS